MLLPMWSKTSLSGQYAIITYYPDSRSVCGSVLFEDTGHSIEIKLPESRLQLPV